MNPFNFGKIRSLLVCIYFLSFMVPSLVIASGLCWLTGYGCDEESTSNHLEVLQLLGNENKRIDMFRSYQQRAKRATSEYLDQELMACEDPTVGRQEFSHSTDSPF